MTGFLKDKAISQIDELLIDGKRFSEEQIKEALKGAVPYSKNKSK